jgi:hypothetical protein
MHKQPASSAAPILSDAVTPPAASLPVPYHLSPVTCYLSPD